MGKKGKMKRRNALKLFGTLFICLMGGPVMADKKNYQTENGALLFSDILAQPTNYELEEEGIKQIIINRKSGKKIIVLFSDICDALET